MRLTDDEMRAAAANCDECYDGRFFYAADMGFRGLFAFYGFFKKRAGLPPAQYRFETCRDKNGRGFSPHKKETDNEKRVFL
jgi:methylphosphotriester-DNA--protein-cysteine methyltransferase